MLSLIWPIGTESSLDVKDIRYLEYFRGPGCRIKGDLLAEMK